MALQLNYFALTPAGTLKAEFYETEKGGFVEHSVPAKRDVSPKEAADSLRRLAAVLEAL